MFPGARQHLARARVVSPDAITVRTWERGAGLTRACGSPHAPSAVAAARKGLTDRKVTVTLPGGH